MRDGWLPAPAAAHPWVGGRACPANLPLHQGAFCAWAADIYTCPPPCLCPAGDPNVPAGAVSWKAAIGRNSRLPGERSGGAVIAPAQRLASGCSGTCFPVPACGREVMLRHTLGMPRRLTGLLPWAAPALNLQWRCTRLRWA